MATVIFVGKENGQTGIDMALKEGLKLGFRPVKALDGRTQVLTPHIEKVFNAPSALPKTSRKILGTVNRATEKPVKTNGLLKQKHLSFTGKNITETTMKASTSVSASNVYPEIEKFFPFNLLDFESFDLPEEHQIPHLPLSGIPLMVLDEEWGLETLLELGPPLLMKKPCPMWESDLLQSPSSFLSSLDIKLSPVCYDLDI
ncbi:PREDICTED: securin-like [Dipodomys ordii]|uniref:Securin n=1 Tax=Dipodomys ordii TaxID=10020 RepID=A0A1S3GE33_DIPOR|nr:PREDICTED: securin-like [Dipodomys ordii]